jgi:hypothetical protein
MCLIATHAKKKNILVAVLILLLLKCFNAGSAGTPQRNSRIVVYIFLKYSTYRSGIQLGFPRDLNSCKLNTMQTILNFHPAVQTFTHSLTHPNIALRELQIDVVYLC